MNSNPIPAPRVLIVEDEEPQRINLHEALERRGFEVKSAGDVASAMDHCRAWGNTIDVALLDMMLEDPNAPGVYGTEIGFEIQRHQNSQPAEFLVLTAHPRLHFMEEALRLGAAAYLHKPTGLSDVILHIRSLALRRRVAAEAVQQSNRIRKIVGTSHSRSWALARYCRESLDPLFEKILGIPALFLFSDSAGTRSCGGELHDPDMNPRGFFHTVAGLAFGNLNDQKSFTMTKHRFPSPRDEMETNLLERMEGACVVSLAEIHDFRLSVVLLHPQTPRREDLEELAPVLANYVRTAVTTQLLGVATVWAELAARRRAVLGATSRFCLYIGQQQVNLLEEARGESTIESSALKRLHDLGEDLYTAGHLLADLYEGPATEPARECVDVMDLVRRSWHKLAPAAELSSELLQTTGACMVEANQGDLATAIQRLLRWLAQRGQGGPAMRITVTCEQDEEGTRITFQDASRRLPEYLREQVFLPFAESEPRELNIGVQEPDGTRAFLSLYLARTLLEVKNRGYLEDHTEDLEGEDGHCFVVGLPNPMSFTSQPMFGAPA